MILLFKQFGNREARIIPNVVDCQINGDEFVWKIGKKTNKFRKGIPLAVMEIRYQFAYALCGENDCARMGVGDSLIKWLVWDNVWIADYTESAALAYIKRHQI